ncbi:ABC transporter permease [Actomonas aquatica]|uniref:ABC transporter permease n=1 Tax=Actomonas aquatica TaxID=2866162 RepID=A0ABZ1CDK6_9BACT|nr:ABC transporter permease [Opitutus sp. WL0086]WRQ88380.1 ABC transporter permease [Opitutus sp. WL0086]
MLTLRHALRQLFKSPGFAALTILTLGLGIGATSAMFTVVNSVLLQPVSYPRSEELVVIRQNNLPRFPTFSLCPADYLDFEREADQFSAMYASRSRARILTGNGDPERVSTLAVTDGYFDTLLVQPILGRAFTPEENEPDGGRAVVLLHHYWQSHLGGRAAVLGETLTLDGEVFTIVGIMPPDFRRDAGFDMLTPMAFSAEERTNRGGHYISGVGRLAPGATAESAQAQLVAISARLATDFPDTNTGWSAFIVPILEWNTGNARPTLLTLLGAVGFLLLIACANVGNLVLARATDRHHELSVRAALGAARSRILGMLLTENVLLGLFGGALGLLVAYWGVDLLMALGSEEIPRSIEVGLDWRAVAFTTVLSILTGIFFGLAPAWQVRDLNLADALKTGARGGGADRSRQRFRNTLVVVEIMLALVLLNASGLMAQSFRRLLNTDPGFNPTHTWMAQFGIPQGRYDTPEKRTDFVRQAEAELAAIPGVEAVGTTVIMPMTGNDYVLQISFPDRPVVPGQEVSADYTATSPGYFNAMGIPILRGRAFTEQDRADAPPVAIVSESFARQFFPDGDALGERFSISNRPEPVWREIVAIVPDIKQAGLDQTATAQMYEPFAQSPHGFLSMVVRTGSAAGTTGLPQAIRQAIFNVDPAQPVFRLADVESLIADSVSRRRFGLTLLGVFSGLSLPLAALGIYGVIAYAVMQRTREFGVRMALGAQGRQVLGLVVRDGLRLLAWGVGLGSLVSLAAGGLLASQLHETSPRDPLILAAVALTLSVVALAACLLPARRATRVNPVEALRAE